MKYLCPECRAVLNPAQGIVLVGRHGAEGGLFIFDPRPGAYGYTVRTSLELGQELLWEFSCPLCQANLTSPFSDKLARLRLVDEGVEFLIVFTKRASQRSTFMLTREDGSALGDELNSFLELSLTKHYW